MSDPVRVRITLKSKLTIFGKFIAQLKQKAEITEVDILELNERFSKVSPLLDKFDEIQSYIEEDLEADPEVEAEARESFENDYHKQVAQAKLILDKQKPPAPPVSQENSVATSQIKLPTIQLPKFDGAYSGWLEFRDTYESMIHKNESIPNIQKFHYLRSALEGSAAVVIRSLEFTAVNYEIAWESLLNRYNNKRLLINNHVKALFSIEPLVKESAESLRKVMDIVTKNLRALSQLDQPTAYWDTMVVHLVVSKLDLNSLRAWENYKAEKEVPTLADLQAFVKARADILETLQLNQSDKRQIKSHNTKGFLSTENKPFSVRCKLCKKEHYINNCTEFLKLPVSERSQKVLELKLCTNCLSSGHYSKICRRGTCKKCHAKHHSLLHAESTNSDDSQALSSASTATSSLTLSACTFPDHVLLSTAYVDILDKQGRAHTIRVILDSGSQSSYLTQATCKQLGLDTSKTNVAVIGLNHVQSNIDSTCNVTIQSLHNNFKATLSCLILPEITGKVPNIKLDVSDLKVPKNITLADPDFFRPKPVDMLIGSDLFWKLICVGQISLGRGLPVLQKTRFGWIVSGPVSKFPTSTVMCSFSQSVSDRDIQVQLARFWELEECVISNPFSKDQLECEKHFVENTKRAADGRFIVSLPMKDSVEKLGDSYEQARSRLVSMEKKLNSKPDLKKHYVDFMSEYKALGHMTKVDITKNNQVAYYMPHHCVVREESLTTKLRVVFDASAPTTTGFSLNNLQLAGPTIQNDLFSILLRFRQHRYVVAGDIAKMYRQILVSPEQRPLQRILWRDNLASMVDVYELNTVTYGTTAASFLAIRCLFQLAQENKEKHPELSEIIESDFYVDDMLTGAETVERAAYIAKGISDILKQGCFELRKFYSNNKEVLKYITDNDAPTKVLNFGVNENAKTLGLAWCPTSDSLTYSIGQPNTSRGVTKRSILSSISQVFDPLCLLSPCIITAKIMMQELWLLKVSWDEALPQVLHSKWVEFITELRSLNSLQINRHVICENPERIEICGFADASEKAYGACIYIRSISRDGQISVNLLCSKTKVAPLKSITLPRLELSAALILARLSDKVSKSLRLTVNKRIFWSDSTVVLGWLKTSPNKLKAFVSNRVAEIQELTASDTWLHVSSGDNPADLLSRGLKLSCLKNSNLWWHGPAWLSKHPSEWPHDKFNTNSDELPEMRKQVQTFTSRNTAAFPFDRFSDLEKLKRVTAWLFRFKNNAQASTTGSSRKLGNLTLSEIINAFKFLVKVSQVESFYKDIHDIKHDSQVSSTSRLLGLTPFLDADEVLRVGGRIHNSNYATDKKHPIVLCSKHSLTKLIFRSEHNRLLHAGPQHLLSSIREQFWPILGRNLAKKTVRQCLTCFRQRPKTIQPIMGQLPESRLQAISPFNTTGIDYAGPFPIKDRTGRGAKVTKCYVGLFVCFATRAIHLELITSLTKDAFILALKRFMARRGKPARIFSDNGTNFVSARSELKDLGTFLSASSAELHDYFLRESIDWKLIPPYSPNFGGLWEAGVKSTKHHLKRVVGKTNLTFEEFYTLLVQVESVVNSRPLFPMSSDPSDLVPLTPAHFLIGKTLLAVPDPDLKDLPVGRLSRFQLVQQLQQHFWCRWHKEYISELQQRVKWKKTQGELKVGAMVLIKDEGSPPLFWRLGRIVKVHPGPDGVSRVATVKTSTGEIKRSYTRLCPLPCQESQKE